MTKARAAIRVLCGVLGLLGASGAMAQTSESSTTSPTTSTSTSTSTSGSASTTTSTSPSTSGSASTTTSTSPSGSTTTSTSPSGSTSTTTRTSPITSGSGSASGTGVEQPPPEPAEGDGRDVDFLWIEAFGGVANVNLVAFGGSASVTDPTTSTSVFQNVADTGPMFGGALGFRVYWLAIGARTTFASYSTFQIGTVGGEVALRFPIPVVEPYVRVGFGYAWQGNATYAVTSAGVTEQHATTVYGWAFNAAVGFDIFVVNWFTIGGGIGLDVLNMTRQTDPRMPCMGITDFCPGRGGDAVGYQLSGFGQIGFHF